MSAGTVLDDAIADAMKIAEGVIEAACVDLPDALPLIKLAPLGVGGPGGIAEAITAWNDSAQEVKAAQQSLNGLVSALSQDSWAGQAREAFDHQMQDFNDQLNDSATVSEIVVGVLAGAMAALTPYPGFIPGVATELAITAAAVAAADCTLVLAPEAEAAGMADALACVGIVSAYNVGLAAALSAEAVALEAVVAVDIHDQEKHGDTTIGADFTKAAKESVTAIGEALALDAWSVRGSNKAADKAGEKAAEREAAKLAGKTDLPGPSWGAKDIAKIAAKAGGKNLGIQLGLEAAKSDVAKKVEGFVLDGAKEAAGSVEQAGLSAATEAPKLARLVAGSAEEGMHTLGAGATSLINGTGSVIEEEGQKLKQAEEDFGGGLKRGVEDVGGGVKKAIKDIL